MLSIFQSEVSSLECQVAQLQAQIVQAQERINQLGECEVTAAGAIQALQYAVTRIAGLAPDAIASLKASVLNLFNSGDGGSQVGQPVSGGPLPIAPSPDFMCVDSHTSTPALVSAAPEPDIALQEQLVASAVMEVSATQPSDGTEHLEGQSCLLEDCPEEALQGQSVEVSCAYTYIKGLTLTHKGDGYEQWEAVEVPQAIAETAINEQASIEPVGIIAEADSLFKLVELTPSVAYMKRIDSGEILCAYFGGSNKSTLKCWGEWLCINHSVGSKFEVRTSQRLTQFKHEAKIWGMSLVQIQRLAESDTIKRPPSNFGTIPKREAQRVPSDIELQDIGVGDIVRSVTVRHGDFRVIQVNQDGFYVCERLGTNPPITQTLHPGSVELVTKAVSEDVAVESIQPVLHPLARIDYKDVPDGIRLTLVRDDLLIQHEVWMTTEQRVMGQTKIQQRQIGTLLETKSGIEANRPRASVAKVFSRTLDAVAYLISGSGLKPLPKAKEPVLVGAVADSDIDDF